jgi:hypothetical protein
MRRSAPRSASCGRRPRRCRCTYSALARSRADWLVGMNLSRLFTVLGRQAGYDGVLSVGRVQTPTLKLVVDRDREIAAFSVGAVLGHRRVPVRRRPGFQRAVGSARWLHRRRRPLPAAARRPAGRAADPRRGQCPGGVGRDRARARRPAAAVRPGHLAGGLFQAAWAGRAGNPGDRPGPVRDAQGHDVPALRFGLPARKHVRRGACGPGQPAQDRSHAAPDHGPARPLPSARAPGTTARSRRTTASSRRSNRRTSRP